MATLRVMELRDVPAVIRLHQDHLAQGFFVELGETFLRRYYRTFLTSPAAVALVAEVGGQLAGFLVGCTDAEVHRRHVAHLEGWRLARAGAASLLLHPVLAGKFVRTRAQRYAQRLRHATQETSGQTPAERTGTLSHLAVDQAMRRHGVGSRLVTGFVDIAKVHGVGCLRLHMAPSNVDARRFYTNLGWKEQESLRDSEGGTWIPFAKDL
ncbi:GNAT family N-acetyltransferase [Sinosporangium siamense]|nr:GNAT family N-acetyltransferase [Sinosporangium siamense]